MKRALLVLAVCAFAGCGSEERGNREIRVFAATSLTESFTQLGRELAADDPRLRIRFNFAATSALVQQLEGGEHADVIATADIESMLKLITADRIEPWSPFTRNRLAIVVRKGNPKQIRSIADLARPGVLVSVCASQVPCGKLANEAVVKAKVSLKVATRDENVRAVLTRVRLGEVDAGIVYATDVRVGSDDAEGVEIPDEHNVVTTYPIAVVKATKNRTDAQAFVRYVTSAAGAHTLARFGFMPAQ